MGSPVIRTLTLFWVGSLALGSALSSAASGAEYAPVKPTASAARTGDYHSDREVVSPDGRFAVRTFGEPDQKDCVLRACGSGEVLARVGTAFRSSRTLWSADSRRVAIVLQDGSSAPSTVKVFAWHRGGFAEQTLPELREPRLRPGDEADPTLVHWMCRGAWEPVRWKRDGALVLVGHTEANGTGRFAHAWTILTLAPRRQARWAVVSEIRRHSSDQGGGPTGKLTGKAQPR